MARALPLEELVAGVLEGDRRALARAISVVENREPQAEQLVAAIYGRTGRAATVGVTGPPGVGKSTLIGALTGHLRSLGRSVGVLSVDPSSPFTRGAVLGDRIRLADHFLDQGVFIRSMATRGHMGGVAEATLQAVLLLDAAGRDVVFVETVGTGQSEIEIAQVADTVLLALMPGSGDSVQALKAGIMEIPDVIAITKRRNPGAESLLRDVRAVLALAPERCEWQPAIVTTEAVEGEGIPELWEAVERHRAYLAEGGRLAARRGRNMAAEVFAIASARARDHLERAVDGDPELSRLLRAVERRELDPVTAVREILERVFRIDGTAGAR